MHVYSIHIIRERERGIERAMLDIRRYINGVVSNGVVSKKTDLQMVAKPAPEIFRIQGTYHNKNKQTHNQGGINRPYLELWRDKPALLIRPGLVRPEIA